MLDGIEIGSRVMVDVGELVEGTVVSKDSGDGYERPPHRPSWWNGRIVCSFVDPVSRDILHGTFAWRDAMGGRRKTADAGTVERERTGNDAELDGRYSWCLMGLVREAPPMEKSK